MQLPTSFGLNETGINTYHRPASCQESFFTCRQRNIHSSRRILCPFGCKPSYQDSTSAIHCNTLGCDNIVNHFFLRGYQLPSSLYDGNSTLSSPHCNPGDHFPQHPSLKVSLVSKNLYILIYSPPYSCLLVVVIAATVMLIIESLDLKMLSTRSSGSMYFSVT
jgi:hypothetical protein